MRNPIRQFEIVFRKWNKSGICWLISLILGGLFLPILSATITSIITIKFVAPEQKQPNLISKMAWNSGKLKTPPRTQLKLNYKQDPTPFIFLSVENVGTYQEEDLMIEIEIHNNLMKQGTIPKKNYIPRVLRRNVDDSKLEKKLFYEYFNSFPTSAMVEYTILTDDYVKNDQDIIPSIMSKTNNWTHRIIYNVRNKFSFLYPLIPPAWAKETSRNKEESKIGKWATDDSIGGYSPIVMAKGISDLLIEKNLITQEKYDSIQAKMKRRKPEAVFGGIDVVELSLLILKILESNEIFSKDQSKKIIDLAKSAGGIMTMGYNVIILQVAILDKLIVDKKIDINLDEAQEVINKAQVKPKIEAGHIP